MTIGIRDFLGHLIGPILASVDSNVIYSLRGTKMVHSSSFRIRAIIETYTRSLAVILCIF